jgi:hypothetical protein
MGFCISLSNFDIGLFRLGVNSLETIGGWAIGWHGRAQRSVYCLYGAEPTLLYCVHHGQSSEHARLLGLIIFLEVVAVASRAACKSSR